MWLLLSARLRRWVVAVIALPAALFAVRALRQRLEARSGPTMLSKALVALESIGARFAGTGGRRAPMTRP